MENRRIRRRQCVEENYLRSHEATAASLEEIRASCAAQVGALWDEVKRFEYPHRYYVDLSQKLWDLRAKLLADYTVD